MPLVGRADAALTDATIAVPDTTPSGVLDCALLSSDNCWKTTVLAAASCAPPAAATNSLVDVGTLSADGLTCTYASGTVVTFERPLVANGESDISTFTVTTDGKPCLHVLAASNGTAVTTPAGTVTVVASQDGGTVSLICPDGSTYVGTAATLSACEAGTIPGLNAGQGGVGFSDGASSIASSIRVTVTIEDANSGDGLVAFVCGTPL
jgi:hypothetical protein